MEPVYRIIATMDKGTWVINWYPIVCGWLYVENLDGIPDWKIAEFAICYGLDCRALFKNLEKPRGG